MKILVISHSAVIERYQQKFEFLANRLGHEVLLVIPKTWVEGGQQMVHGRDRVKGNLRVRALTCFLRPSLRRHFYWGLTSIAKKMRPDLIYAEEEPQARVADQAAMIAKRRDAKFIFFTWENIPQVYRGEKKRIEERIYRQSDGAISGNQAGREILQNNGYQKPIEIIPQYGVDPDFFHWTEASILRKTLKLENRFIIGYVGRLLPEKNIASLLQTLTALPSASTLVLIGNGPEQATLEKRSQELRLGDRVKFIPAVSYEQMPQYFSLFHVLVLPSITTQRWKEQFGRVLIEAMACGIPVIGSDSGEIPRVIGGAGLIFPEGNITRLVQNLQLIYSRPAQARKFSQLGRSRVEALFTNEKIAERLGFFFKKITTT